MGVLLDSRWRDLPDEHSAHGHVEGERCLLCIGVTIIRTDNQHCLAERLRGIIVCLDMSVSNT